jgi:hypothetical protein
VLGNITRTISITLTTRTVIEDMVTTTTTDPSDAPSVPGNQVSSSTTTPKTINASTFVQPSGTTSPSPRRTQQFDVPSTNLSSYITPQPSSPININIFIQNSIILTTTQNYVPPDSTDAVTVTSTVTVTTVVPCSTDPSQYTTLTAKVLEILIVPCPTPYVDPSCGCTKSSIVYIDNDDCTQTIYVDPSTSVSLLPTDHPSDSDDEDSCPCTDCYYTVKKTATVTMTCTASPNPRPPASIPTWVSAGWSLQPATAFISLLTAALGILLFR